MRRIGILGTGLIGASIGLGLRGLGARVTGWDPNPATLEAAANRGAIDAAPSRGHAVAAAQDLLVVAAPPSATIGLVARLSHTGLVIDVAGVKGPVVAASNLPRFVGTHPMAGREVSGPEVATAALFRGAAWVVVTDGASSDDVDAVSGVVGELGARPVVMTAAEHDAAVAAISHVPQLLAAGLIAAAAGAPRGLDLAAGSFRDLTRVAASHPDLWVDLLTANRGPVSAALDAIRANIEALQAWLSEDPAALAGFLSEAREVRQTMTARTASVRLALADQPGEIARVGRALEASAVDVRDMQLMHSPHGGGGILTLFVRPGDGELLRHALEDEGLLVLE